MKHLLFALCLFTTSMAWSQFNTKVEREVGYFIHHKDYTEALRILNQSEIKDEKNPAWNFYSGKALYEMGKHDSSLIYLETSKKAGYSSSELDFYLGDLSQKQNKFAEAKSHFSNYLARLDKSNKNYPEKKRKVAKRIEECENGIRFKSESKNISIENLGSVINSEYPDYAPVISADEQTLFFTSRRPNSIGGLKDARDGWHMEDIYLCVKDSTDSWTAPQQMPGYINSSGHDANIGLSPDGQSLFIYRDDAIQSGLAGNIYESMWKFHRWSTPELLPDPVNTEYWETGISTTPDEKTLYFSSNRPGGYGGLDIYRVRQLPDGSWARPQNLGPSINTEYNEESPFIHPDGKTLYFSSQGHSSMGGFDIFTSSLEDSLWSEPENMGYPLNTSQNELYFVLSADASRGYFSGIRSETFGDKDLYVANLPKKPVQIILLKGRVIDKKSEKPLATLIKVFDNESKELVYVLNSNGVNGRFSSVLPPHKNYNIQVAVDEPGYTHYSMNIHIPEQKEFVQIDTTIRLQKDDTIHVITLLPNIFFKLNVAELDSSSELELDALARRMFNNPKLNLEIAVHTYSQKNKEENLRLSQRRAETIKQNLMNRGVEGNRIFPVGYGQYFPSERERNDWVNNGNKPKDRTEAIIIPNFEVDMKPADDGFYYANNYKAFDFEPEPEEAEMIALNNDEREEKKDSGVAEETKKEDLSSSQSAESSEDGEEIEKSSSRSSEKLKGLRVFFVVNRIYFRIDPDTVLTEVMNYMKEHPEQKIIIHSYTDTVGHPDYNIFLSKIRADNVKKEMVKRGADADRIETVGHGQINPIFSNKTRPGRMKNRRAEFEAIPIED